MSGQYTGDNTDNSLRGRAMGNILTFTRDDIEQMQAALERAARVPWWNRRYYPFAKTFWNVAVTVIVSPMQWVFGIEGEYRGVHIRALCFDLVVEW